MSDLETLFPNPTDGARSCRHLSPSDLFVPTAGPTGPLLGPLSGPPPSGQVRRSLLVTESRKTVHFAAYEDRSFFIYTFCTVPGSLICQSSLFFFVLAFFVAPCPAPDAAALHHGYCVSPFLDLFGGKWTHTAGSWIWPLGGFILSPRLLLQNTHRQSLGPPPLFAPI